MRTVTFLAKGQLECPVLFIVHPLPKPGASKPLFFPESLKLYFLCGHSMQPVLEEGCCVDLGGESRAIEFLQAAGPALKTVMNVLKFIAAAGRIASGINLEDFLPFDGGTGLLERVKLAQEWADGVASTLTGEDDQDALESLDRVLEAAEAERSLRLPWVQHRSWLAAVLQQSRRLRRSRACSRSCQ